MYMLVIAAEIERKKLVTPIRIRFDGSYVMM